MVFPDDALDVRVDLQVGTTWTDITPHVYTRNPITITRGRGDEGSRVDPSKCSLTLNNKDGRYSPRNPLSPYYGLIGRNTPIRVSVPADATHLKVLTIGGSCSTPDTAVLDITGDIDVRVELSSTTSGGHDRGLVGKYLEAGGQRSWVFWQAYNGCLQLYWSTDGGNLFTATSTVPLPNLGQRIAVRVTLDVNNGASGWTATFYTSTSISGTWTQLGAPVTQAGVTSIFNSTAPLQIGSIASSLLDGQVYAAEVRNGIGGTVVANPVFTTKTPGATSFTDGAGRSWTVNSPAEITDRSYRFVGEVPSWPVRWGPSGKDTAVTLEAAGIMRRLGQGAKPLQSALYRSITGAATPYTAYWPLEDGAGSTQAASAYPAVAPMVALGPVEFGQATSTGTSVAVSMGDGGRLIGAVQGGSAEWIICFWLDLPADMGSGAASPILQWRTPGGTKIKQYSLYTGQAINGQLLLEGADTNNNIVISQGMATDLRGLGPTQVIVECVDAGTDVVVNIWLNPFGTDGGALSVADDPGPITSIGVNMAVSAGQTYSGTISHIIVTQSPRWGDLFDHTAAGTGWTGETAAARMLRLGAEESVTIDVIGDPAASSSLGPQRPLEVLELFGEAADADGGMLFERHDTLGLRYRTRSADYNTAASLSLDYLTQIAAPLEPVDDDQTVRNDITISRDGGSSSRAVLQTGALSVQAPPGGVGIYNEEVSLNVATDGQLSDLAGWRLHLGTVDQARYPVVGMKLHKNPGLTDDVLLVDLRARLYMSGLPSWEPPGIVDLLIEGYEEVLEPRRWWLEFNCVPGSPWRVAVADDTVLGRLDTDGSQLTSSITATATSVSVTVTAGPLWTTTGAQFPFDVTVDGEVMRVTAISGASSPQTFTVTRSINGIAKTHGAAAGVRLAQPMTLAL